MQQTRQDETKTINNEKRKTVIVETIEIKRVLL